MGREWNRRPPMSVMTLLRLKQVRTPQATSQIDAELSSSGSASSWATPNRACVEETPPTARLETPSEYRYTEIASFATGALPSSTPLWHIVQGRSKGSHAAPA